MKPRGRPVLVDRGPKRCSSCGYLYKTRKLQGKKMSFCMCQTDLSGQLALCGRGR